MYDTLPLVDCIQMEKSHSALHTRHYSNVQNTTNMKLRYILCLDALFRTCRFMDYK